MIKPGIPKGTRDFGPNEVYKRNYIFSVIREHFERFGYHPIETPVMENLQTLTGKYGDEGDKLLFKVLNNGDFLAKADADALAEKDSSRLVPSISRRGLRYDLTVPFARYVVMHQHEISFPFKRYQIQPVWRADRPQKGRYQEFYQCDADVIGSGALVYEAELVQLMDSIFKDLGIQVRMRINHRKILEGMIESIGAGTHLFPVITVIDKWLKVGEKGVYEQLKGIGLADEHIDQLVGLMKIRNVDHLPNDEGKMRDGVADLKNMLGYLGNIALENELVFDPSLARGLDYYTGCIFEVQAMDHAIGSVLGGGRYDNLTGFFGLPNVSGVGISFGVARIFDVMQALELFPEDITQPLQVMIMALDHDCHQFAFSMVTTLRKEGIKADLFPTPSKLKKQMKYANNMNVPFALMIGPEEMQSQSYTLRDMRSGDQDRYTIDQIIRTLHARK